jgi:hypothetical protein
MFLVIPFYHPSRYSKYISYTSRGYRVDIHCHPVCSVGEEKKKAKEGEMITFQAYPKIGV